MGFSTLKLSVFIFLWVDNIFKLVSKPHTEILFGQTSIFSQLMLAPLIIQAGEAGIFFPASHKLLFIKSI